MPQLWQAGMWYMHRTLGCTSGRRLCKSEPHWEHDCVDCTAVLGTDVFDDTNAAAN